MKSSGIWEVYKQRIGGTKWKLKQELPMSKNHLRNEESILHQYVPGHIEQSPRCVGRTEEREEVGRF